MIKTTKAALGELAHKARIVADEPDLQESYGITEQEAIDVTFDLMRMQRKGAMFYSGGKSNVLLRMLADEAEDAAVVFRDIARAATSPSERKKAREAALDLDVLAQNINATITANAYKAASK